VRSADNDVLVRPYAAGDRGALVELLTEVWSRKRDIDREIEQRWWWQHAPPPLYVVEQRAERRLAGLCAFLPFSLRTHGRDVSAAWFVDFYVLPEHQGRGWGRRLTQAVQDRFPITASLSQTAMAYRVFQKMGWRERTPVTVYMHPWAVRGVFPAPARDLRVTTSAPDAARNLAGDLDALWNRVRDAFGAVSTRDSATLLPRFASRPGREYSIVRCHRGEDCAGYMVVRIVPGAAGRRRGLIVDHLAHPDDGAAFKALLSAAASVLIEGGVRRIYCLSSAPQFERILRSRGFLSPDTPIVGRRLRSQRKWLTWTARPDVPPIDPAGWFLTMSDCDLDYTWDG
jgi:GNAT superfamily N-acetyltransferase